MYERRTFLREVCGAAAWGVLIRADCLPVFAAPPGSPEYPALPTISGRMGPIVRLANGSFLAVYGEGEVVPQDHPASRQLTTGRISIDGITWGEPYTLFEMANSPGSAGVGTTSGGALPLVTGKGTVHVFGLRYFDMPVGPDYKTSDFFKARVQLYHASSNDDAKTWSAVGTIDYGHRYTGALNSVIQLRSGRILLAFSYLSPVRRAGLFVSHAILSDDDGKTWRTSRNEVALDSGGRGLESGAPEPVTVELPDGRVWMVIRNQTGYLFESWSEDGGDSWSPPKRTIFRASNAPAGVLRLKDGRMVLVWNNEFGPPFYEGISYSRRSLVMAVQEGSSWRGYRELVTFGAQDGGTDANDSWGARYPYLVETEDGHVLVAYAEDGRASRAKAEQAVPWVDYRVARIDLRWLLETTSTEDFSEGLAHVQVSGKTGVRVLRGPEGKPAMFISRPEADKIAGISWNFPFGRKGVIRLRLRAEPGFGGTYFALSEEFVEPTLNEGGAFRWMIGSDLKLKMQYMPGGPFYNANAGAVSTDENRRFELEAGHIHELSVSWNCETNTANVQVDGFHTATLVGLSLTKGMSYLRIRSAATETDASGLWVLELRTSSEV
jgi:hypothetical protein